MEQRIKFILSNFFFQYKFKALNPHLLKAAFTKRFKKSATRVKGKKVCYTDSASFISIYNEVFIREIYKFKTNNTRPNIIDCGANIGLSVLYFKHLFPKALLTAFEPDKQTFVVLQQNCNSFNLGDVKLYNKGLWKEKTTLHFEADGADGGRILEKDNGTTTIETVCLSDFLDKQVDFLKIDIEGAEFEVLKECQQKLVNVKCMFVEYHSFIKQPQQLSALLQILADAGFRYHIHHEGRFSKQPFIKRRLMGDMDLQLNIFAYRD